MKTKKSVRNRLNPTKVKNLYARLKSVGAVAKELGASYMGIRRNLLAHNVKLVRFLRQWQVPENQQNSLRP
jgi:hypothetical protein